MTQNRRMKVRKINIVPKMTIHVTNMFKICAVLPWKMVFRGFPDYVIRKHHVTHPIFWGFRITKSEKIRYSFFHPLTKENTIPDHKIQKFKGIFGKNRAHEEIHRVGKVNPLEKRIWNFKFVDLLFDTHYSYGTSDLPTTLCWISLCSILRETCILWYLT